METKDCAWTAPVHRKKIPVPAAPHWLRLLLRCGNRWLTLRPLRRKGWSRPMNQLLMEYLPLVVFMGVALVIGLALMVAPFLVAVRNPDPEKVSAYECGFNAFDDARMKFDVRFYLVSILFIIFDLEVAFLFPWAVAFKHVGAFGFWSMMAFLGVLTIGFIYEWRKGALEWD
jgi:NADH-quinone oxidoreductase subunit A